MASAVRRKLWHHSSQSASHCSDRISGDATGGDATGGDATDGDAIGGDVIGGDAIGGGDTIGGDAISNDANGGAALICRWHVVCRKDPTSETC